ncbi:Uncharacterized protein AXF42_Ash002175 [Apostasia shenzhenica]|uniref:Uncharacterized protein n=1 Tax=Apostasia shenzhenica TaxID=1088818 RepID=A0A2I0AMT7_9ASPA|nr:Uncharacterized protein AXF42_Ash002175 [Apostasia shenzhenica]
MSLYCPSFLPRLLLIFSYIHPTIISSSTSGLYGVSAAQTSAPTPRPWPLQFHAKLFMNYSGELSVVDLWYDWPNARNLHIIQPQLGELLYDVEWSNGTSFYFSPSDSSPRCRTVHFDVGILRPDWLDGAAYLGRRVVDGFLCNVWEKLGFIWYYEDVSTRRPVHWVFYTGRSVHVMTFDVGEVLEDSKWQAPAKCFEEKVNGSDIGSIADDFASSLVNLYILLL